MSNELSDFVLAEIAAELGVSIGQYRKAHARVARRLGVNIENTVQFLVPDVNMPRRNEYMANQLRRRSGMERRFSDEQELRLSQGARAPRLCRTPEGGIGFEQFRVDAPIDPLPDGLARLVKSVLDRGQ